MTRIISKVVFLVIMFYYPIVLSQINWGNCRALNNQQKTKVLYAQLPSDKITYLCVMNAQSCEYAGTGIRMYASERTPIEVMCPAANCEGSVYEKICQCPRDINECASRKLEEDNVNYNNNVERVSWGSAPDRRIRQRRSDRNNKGVN